MVEKQRKLKRSDVKLQLNEIITIFHKVTNIKKPEKLGTKDFAKIDPAKKGATFAAKKSDSLQELIDYLRVCVKYMVFSSEAANRELEYLRELLKQKD